MKEQLITLLHSIENLKKQGVKMKDIAQAIDFAPSVLSAVYSTVLPSFMDGLHRELSPEKALDYAISQVNNVSKRKLLSNLDRVLEVLADFQVNTIPASAIAYLGYLERQARGSGAIKGKLDGLFLSYSQSSASHRTLKVEPYLFSTSEDGRTVMVKRTNTSGSVHEGFAVVKEHKALHLFFNEADDSFFAPVTTMLSLPFSENYNILKGLYLCMDVANNPIARRIVLKRISSDTSQELFSQTPSHVMDVASVEGDMKALADYLCTPQDALRVGSVPSSGCLNEDLINEKKILSLLHQN